MTKKPFALRLSKTDLDTLRVAAQHARTPMSTFIRDAALAAAENVVNSRDGLPPPRFFDPYADDPNAAGEILLRVSRNSPEQPTADKPPLYMPLPHHLPLPVLRYPDRPHMPHRAVRRDLLLQIYEQGYTLQESAEMLGYAPADCSHNDLAVELSSAKRARADGAAVGLYADSSNGDDLLHLPYVHRPTLDALIERAHPDYQINQPSHYPRKPPAELDI